MATAIQRLGAAALAEGACEFLVWAPAAEYVEVRIVAPRERIVPMDRGERGYYQARIDHLRPGTRYFYRLNGHTDRPDPASRFQPEGVHGPSEVIAREFPWTDAGWAGLPLRDYILYELHVGTFTPEGTFDAAIARLDDLKELGINAIELMPVAQFPGARNWGYDGAYPYAVQNSYGGPHGLKRLVNEAHQRQMAVVLDVVYNHLGPEGNYLRDFGPYFTDKYKTPWGSTVNFDGAASDEVRRFFVENALYWITEFHIDALRLDAIHGIYDFSAVPFLRDLADAVRVQSAELARHIYLIAESDLNDARVVTPPEKGGLGLDAQWNDDFHHALHALLTGERTGYYADFGSLSHLARAYRDGFVYSGQYSEYRQCRHGNSSRAMPPQQFVVFSQNHDQVGNRALGDRLSTLLPFEALKLAAAAVILSPSIPLLFMGEEYGEPAHFQYFVDHSDPALVEAVRKGRADEFKSFRWNGELPDPAAGETFLRSKLNWNLRGEGIHRELLEFYKELIRVRRRLPAGKTEVEIDEARGRLLLPRHTATEHITVEMDFRTPSVSVRARRKETEP